MSDGIDFDGVADIGEAIEDAGGHVRDFDTSTTTVDATGLAGVFSAVMGDQRVRTYQFEVAIPSDTQRPSGDEDTASAPRDDAQVIADVLTTIWGRNPQVAVSDLEAGHLLDKLASKFDPETVQAAADAAGWDTTDADAADDQVSIDIE